MVLRYVTAEIELDELLRECRVTLIQRGTSETAKIITTRKTTGEWSNFELEQVGSLVQTLTQRWMNKLAPGKPVLF